MSTPADQHPDSERRAYFRVQEPAGLQLVPVAEDSREPAAGHFVLGGRLVLQQQFQELDRDGRFLLDRLGAANRDMAAVARWLDRKLDLLAAAVCQQQGEDALGVAPVSLSLVGLTCPNPLQGMVLRAGQRVALALQLLPDHTLITCHARILQASDATAVLEYSDLAEDDQQRLTRHLLRAQSRARKDR